jgi:hypothetical protein
MSPDWERSALFEKMVRVQRDNARKSEKLDFLEEHVQDLLAEVKKKNRIIQFFFAKEDSGSMATEASDRHKVSGPPFHRNSSTHSLTLTNTLDKNGRSTFSFYFFFFSFSLFAALSGHEIDVPGKMSQK